MYLKALITCIISRLQKLEENFYQLVDIPDIATKLELTTGVVDLIFVYWKLKRRVSYVTVTFVLNRDDVSSDFHLPVTECMLQDMMDKLSNRLACKKSSCSSLYIGPADTGCTELECICELLPDKHFRKSHVVEY